MKADVLQHHNLAGLDFGAQTVGVWADHILSQRNRELEQLGKALGHRGQRILGVYLALGPAQVGYNDDGGAAGDQIPQRGQSALDAPLICQMTVFIDWGIKIAADQNFFAPHIDIAHGLFVKIHHDNPSSPATIRNI